MQSFTGQFYLNEKTFVLGSQILFPVILINALQQFLFCSSDCNYLKEPQQETNLFAWHDS